MNTMVYMDLYATTKTFIIIHICHFKLYVRHGMRDQAFTISYGQNATCFEHNSVTNQSRMIFRALVLSKGEAIMSCAKQGCQH